jgi:predicted nucleotidyltransferase component of viral defense system
MLDPTEAQTLAEQFGASSGQIARDHLISHLLAALSTHAADQVIFFGGTALARALLPDGRLSEDIDLIAQGSRRDAAQHLHATLPRALRREYPNLRWNPALTQVRDAEPAVLHSPEGLTVRVQLLSPLGYPPWPVHRVNLIQRYSDAPPARLTVPTAPAFAASKTTAWFHRVAARDLYDLWALATHGHLSTEAAELFARHGPTNRPPTPDLFRTAPNQDQWQRDLGGQLRLTVTAAQALTAVRDHWATATRSLTGPT